MIRTPLLTFFAFLTANWAFAGELETAPLAEQVRQTEHAFAQTMADRDFEAFTGFLSSEAIFFAGDTPLRGSEAVAARWKAFFETPEVPFSWRPKTVEVLESGTLALSSGPVYGPDGKCIGGFYSIWRREASGEWKIVFDKGSKSCEE